MKISINGVPKKDCTKEIKEAIDNLLEVKFSTWKLLFEDSKGGSI